jgi:broad specificity phosphatase PhoE
MISVNPTTRHFEGLRLTSDATTHLYLIRHGQTAGNVSHQLIGHTDMPLDTLGERQAREVGRRMRTIRLDAVVSSPLQRAKVTASEVAQHHRHDIAIDRRLMEMHFGFAEGLTMLEALERFPELERLRHNPLDEQFAWPGGDARDQFHANVFATFTEIAISYQQRHVAVVCHGGVIGSLLAQLDGGSPNDYETYPVANCSVTHLEVHAAGTTAHLINDIAHLEAVRTEPWRLIPDAPPPAILGKE